MQNISAFNIQGQLASPDPQQLTIATQTLFETLKSNGTSSLHKYLHWRFTPPFKKTLSPSSSILLRNHISYKLRKLEYQATITSAHSRAPWHPLAPVSLARLSANSENQIRKTFLCKLTLKRLKAADPELWGKNHLAEDATFAAKIMTELGYPQLAEEATTLAKNLKQ